jgi:hypothetical protein
MKFSKELEARLAKLPPLERVRVLVVARRLAKARLANMLDQLAAKHAQRSNSPRTPRKNSAGETLH